MYSIMIIIVITTIIAVACLTLQSQQFGEKNPKTREKSVKLAQKGIEKKMEEQQSMYM